MPQISQGTITNPVIVATGGVPFAATFVSANSPNNVIVPAVAGKTFYLTHFSISGSGATAASCTNVSTTNLLVDAYFIFSVPAGVNNAVELKRDFTYPVPAKAVNTPVTFFMPAFGAGNTLQCFYVVGYYA